jgi:fermentation-respiration switch protein FrsA (DUF1100 family)
MPPSPTSARTRSTRGASRRKRMLALLLTLSGLYLYLCVLLAWETVKAKPMRMREKPPDLHCEDIRFSSADGVTLRGWLIPAAGRARGVVICCHGLDSTRLAMVTAARILHTARYAVLLFDFRARGESGGNRCTLGYRETDDLLAALAYARNRPDLRGLPLGVLGEAMGGAGALMGVARDPTVRCVVAESPFASLDHAVANHFQMLLGTGAPLLSLPTRWIGERLIGVNCRDVAPVRAIGRIAPRPLLLIEDSADRLCPSTETRALLAAAGPTATIWTVPGAEHIGARFTYPDEYAYRLTSFFNTNLAQPHRRPPTPIH